MKPTRVPLSYPLPCSNWVQTEHGKWYAIAWTRESRKIAEHNRYKIVHREEKK